MSIYTVASIHKAVECVPAENHHQAVFFTFHYLDWCEGFIYKVTDERTGEVKKFKAFKGMQLWEWDDGWRPKKSFNNR